MDIEAHIYIYEEQDCAAAGIIQIWQKADHGKHEKQQEARLGGRVAGNEGQHPVLITMASGNAESKLPYNSHRCARRSSLENLMLKPCFPQ